MAQQILRPIGQTALSLLYVVRGSAAGDGDGLFSLELLHPELAEDEGLRASFLEEAALARHLGDPNLIGTRAIVSDETGYGRTTEWCDGQPLSRVLERVGRTSLPLRLQVWIHCQILSALQHGHHFFEHSFEHSGGPDGLLHGSVSPDSVLLGYDGQVRLLGMGFPRTRAALERRQGQLSIDSCYAAPERHIGSAPTEGEDLYGVGAMLWEAVTQMHRGLASSLVDVAQPRSSDETPSAEELCPDAPQSLTRICQRALAATPAERYPDAFEMRSELEVFLEETSNAAEPEPGPAVLAELLCSHFAAERLDFERLSQPPHAEREVERAATPANDVTALGLLRFSADVSDDRTHTVTSFDEPIVTELRLDAEAVGAEVVDSQTVDSQTADSDSHVAHPEYARSEPVLSDAIHLDANTAQAVAAEGTDSERGRSWPSVASRQQALTQALDPEVIVAAWRARQELKRRRFPGTSARTPVSRVSGTVLGVVGIALLFAIARYGVPGARGLRNAPALPSVEASPSGRGEPVAPSVRSALLPAASPVTVSAPLPRASSEPIASSLTAADAEPAARAAAPAHSPVRAGRLGAAVVGSGGASGAAERAADDTADHFHPRYLRAEDVAQLREIDDSQTAPSSRAGSIGRRQPSWKTRFEKILRSAAPAGSAPREPRRIDEEDPYTP